MTSANREIWLERDGNLAVQPTEIGVCSTELLPSAEGSAISLAEGLERII